MPKSIFTLAFYFCMLGGGQATNSFPNNTALMSYFQVNVTPNVGDPLAFGPARAIRDSLSARGLVLIFDEKPVVKVAIDWIGISNEGMDVFRKSLAKAAGTSEDRVLIHALHQHNAVRCDFLTPRILDRYEGSDLYYDTIFLHDAIDRVAQVVRESLSELQPVTSIGYGKARVNHVASNRRIIGSNGKVEKMRWSNTKSSLLRNEGEGLIDPWLKTVTLYKGEQPLVSMSYYAVHPVTEFGDGIVSSEFVGIARKYQEMKRGYPHIYFTGAAGNIGVGKYNDNTRNIRYTFAARIASAIDKALESEIRKPVNKNSFNLETTLVYLPLANHLDKDSLEQIVSGGKYDPELPYLRAIACLAWWNRVHKDPYVRISALHIDDVRLLSLPGEPFVEYQLMAQDLFPQYRICTAGYEEYGMGYIGTRKAYREGGYETSKMASMLGPDAEDSMMRGIREVLE